MTDVWHLFLDETGDFDEPLDRVAVVGWLWRQSTTTAVALDWLQVSIAEHFPEVPWPAHSTVLQRPAAWAAWSTRGKDTPDGIAAAADRALQQALGNSWTAQRDLYCAGKVPGTESFTTSADSWLRRHRPDLYEVLDRRGQLARRQITSWMTAAANELAEAGALPTPVLAAEAVPLTDLLDPHANRRYMELVGVALARAADIALVQSVGAVDLRVSVLTRRVDNLLIGGPVHLRTQDLSLLAETVVGKERKTLRDGKRLRVVPWQVLRSDANCPAELAMADWLANRCYPVVKKMLKQDLPTVTACLRNMTAQSWQIPELALPAVAAGAPVFDWLQTLRQRGATVHAGPLAVAAPWAQQEAQSWSQWVTP